METALIHVFILLIYLPGFTKLISENMNIERHMCCDNNICYI